MFVLLSDSFAENCILVFRLNVIGCLWIVSMATVSFTQQQEELVCQNLIYKMFQKILT